MSRKVVMCLSLLISAGVLVSLLLSMGGSAALYGVSWATSQAPGMNTPAPTPRPIAGQVQALYQGDPGIGWDTRQQYTLWWPSACSPAALTMALRAWGAPVRIGQVLDRLIAKKAITPQHGLLHVEALESVAKSYGFAATTFWSWKLKDLRHVTDQGVPVLIDVVDAKRQTPYPDFVVGHWLVVVKVTADRVEVRDSSGYHLRTLGLGVFHTLFTGIGVVIWQGASISLP
ncbi:MAG TPA: C39 family peptidase [Ktedonobacterales bacterium]|jgi:hypothetical protein